VKGSESQQVNLPSRCTCPVIDNRGLIDARWVDGGCPIHINPWMPEDEVLRVLTRYGPCMYSQLRSRIIGLGDEDLEIAAVVKPGSRPNPLFFEHLVTSEPF
jgi:hypothetical protein